jgi:hypothetical protein
MTAKKHAAADITIFPGYSLPTGPDMAILQPCKNYEHKHPSGTAVSVTTVFGV